MTFNLSLARLVDSGECRRHVWPDSNVQASDANAWIATQMLNVIAPYLLCRAFAGGMIDAGWGRTST